MNERGRYKESREKHSDAQIEGLKRKGCRVILHVHLPYPWLQVCTHFVPLPWVVSETNHKSKIQAGPRLLWRLLWSALREVTKKALFIFSFISCCGRHTKKTVQIRGRKSRQGVELKGRVRIKFLFVRDVCEAGLEWKKNEDCFLAEEQKYSY